MKIQMKIQMMNERDNTFLLCLTLHAKRNKVTITFVCVALTLEKDLLAIIEFRNYANALK